jgi:hypothetical protein
MITSSAVSAPRLPQHRRVMPQTRRTGAALPEPCDPTNLRIPRWACSSLQYTNQATADIAKRPRWNHTGGTKSRTASAKHKGGTCG